MTFGSARVNGQTIPYVAPPPPPPPVFDDFNRTVAVGLGSTSSGAHPWAHSSGAGFVIPSVDGAQAVCQFTPTTTDWYTYFEAITNGVPAELARNSFVFTTRFKQDAATSGGAWDYIEFDWYALGVITIHVAINAAPGPSASSQVVLYLSNGALDTGAIVIPDVVPGEWYSLKLDYLAGAHARVKFWRESLGEPAGWLGDITNPAVPDNTGCDLWTWVNSDAASGSPTYPTFARVYDYIQIV